MDYGEILERIVRIETRTDFHDARADRLGEQIGKLAEKFDRHLEMEQGFQQSVTRQLLQIKYTVSGGAAVVGIVWAVVSKVFI